MPHATITTSFAKCGVEFNAASLFKFWDQYLEQPAAVILDRHEQFVGILAQFCLQQAKTGRRVHPTPLDIENGKHLECWLSMGYVLDTMIFSSW